MKARHLFAAVGGGVLLTSVPRIASADTNVTLAPLYVQVLTTNGAGTPVTPGVPSRRAGPGCEHRRVMCNPNADGSLTIYDVFDLSIDPGKGDPPWNDSSRFPGPWPWQIAVQMYTLDTSMHLTTTLAAKQITFNDANGQAQTANWPALTFAQLPGGKEVAVVANGNRSENRNNTAIYLEMYDPVTWATLTTKPILVAWETGQNVGAPYFANNWRYGSNGQPISPFANLSNQIVLCGLSTEGNNNYSFCEPLTLTADFGVRQPADFYLGYNPETQDAGAANARDGGTDGGTGETYTNPSYHGLYGQRARANAVIFMPDDNPAHEEIYIVGSEGNQQPSERGISIAEFTLTPSGGFQRVAYQNLFSPQDLGAQAGLELASANRGQIRILGVASDGEPLFAITGMYGNKKSGGRANKAGQNEFIFIVKPSGGQFSILKYGTGYTTSDTHASIVASSNYPHAGGIGVGLAVSSFNGLGPAATEWITYDPNSNTFGMYNAFVNHWPSSDNSDNGLTSQAYGENPAYNNNNPQGADSDQGMVCPNPSHGNANAGPWQYVLEVHVQPVERPGPKGKADGLLTFVPVGYDDGWMGVPGSPTENAMPASTLTPTPAASPAKAGGCGCSVPGIASGGGAPGLLLTSIGLLGAWARRRRS